MRTGQILTNVIINSRHIKDRSAPDSKISRNEVNKYLDEIYMVINNLNIKISQSTVDRAFLITKREILQASELFDEDHYINQVKKYGYEIVGDPIEDYLTRGWLKGWDPNPLFSVIFYVTAHAEHLQHGWEPFSHYIELGSKIMLDPHPLFSTEYFAKSSGRETPRHQTWLTDFLDLDFAPVAISPLINIENTSQISKIENVLVGNVVNYLIESDNFDNMLVPLFDKEYYKSQFEFDLDCIDTYSHYSTVGKFLGAKPHPLFDPAFFRGQLGAVNHPEYQRNYIDELFLYFMSEENKGVNSHPLLDLNFIKKQRPDLKNVTCWLYEFIKSAEVDLDPNPFFDSASYRAQFGPLKKGRTAIEDFLRKINSTSDVQQILLDEQELYDRSCRASHDIQITARKNARHGVSARSSMRNYAGRQKVNEKKHSILLVAHLVGEYLFGSERSFLDMLQGLRSADVNVFVALPRNVPEYTNLVRDLCCSVYVFEYGWWSKDKQPNYEAVENFESIIDEHLISAVHANTIMLRDVLVAARRQSVTTVVHVRELISQDEHLQKILGVSADFAIDEVRSYADWIIGNSRATSSAFQKRGRTVTLYNTIEGKGLIDLENSPTDIIYFGLISSNMPKKGILDLVDVAIICAKICPRAKFLLIGPETSLTRQLRVRQQDGDVPQNIEFSGYSATASDAIGKVNVVLSLSHFAESFGRTVLEAMAGGRPVIAYKYGAVPELITEGRTGYLVNFKDTAAIAEKILIICREPQLIQQMGEAGRAIYLEKFAPEHYARSMAAFYQQVLETTPLRHRVIEVHPRRSRPVKQTKLRLAYFCWHFPVPSETFVLSELRELVSRGVDVIVYCRQVPNPNFSPDFEIRFERVSSHEHLAKRLIETGRNIVHAHFTYPTVTNMVWPACELAQIPFTFIAHAQDIFRYENDRKNRISEIGASPLCQAMFTLSRFHRNYVVERGFPKEKVIINPNAIDLRPFVPESSQFFTSRLTKKILAVGRFVEKKGFSLLIAAAKILANYDIELHIYGYGELDEQINLQIKEENLTNVTVHGPATHGNMPDILRSVDLFVCPCIRAEDGDMDGIPTTIVEAMATGVPVMTTSIGALPEVVSDGITGFVVDPNPDSIAAGVLKFYRTPAMELEVICENARRYALESHDAGRLVTILERVWRQDVIDIVIVSWNNLNELKMVINSILEHTSMPYHLIICDNNSLREPVRNYLKKIWSQNASISLILNNSNDMVGPGTNLAIGAGDGDVIIYVCGKEGVAFAPNWELAFVRGFEGDSKAGLVGTIGHSPAYLTGEQYPRGIGLFDKFRNKHFALQNPKRIFGHIQGGLFAIRRRMFDDIGGFSKEVPHDYTDVEYSFYAESCGWKLKQIDEVLVLFNKSRPTLSQRFRRGLVCAHPVLPTQIRQFNLVLDGHSKHCNICDWYGSQFKQDFSCEECGSTPQDRTLFRWLSEGVYMYRRLPAIGVGLDGKISAVWAEQFQGPRLSFDDFISNVREAGRLPNRNESLHVAWIRSNESSTQNIIDIARELLRLLQPGAPMIVQYTNANFDMSLFYNKTVKELEDSGFEYQKSIRYSDASCEFSNFPCFEFRKNSIYDSNPLDSRGIQAARS